MATPAHPDTVLTTLGYSRREAAFLRMVAMHSGVFLRRQYAAYTQGGRGKATHSLIAKLVGKRHGRPISYGDNKTVYHVTNKRLYRILGIEDSNHRRSRGDQLLKTRLMALDFVLAHAEAQYLETEKDKIAFFSQAFGARQEHLPTMHYRTRRGADDVCTRYFVEKFPLFIADAGDAAGKPAVAFSFIDDGQATVSSFCGFLHRYAQLMSLIPRLRLYYVTDTPTKFAPAEREFARLIMASGHDQPPVHSHAMLRYFELMQRWQEGKTNFSSEEFAELARLRKLYSGLEYDALFEKWRESLPAFSPTAGALAAWGERDVQFIAAPLPDEYRFLGEFRGPKGNGDGGSRPGSPFHSLLGSPRAGSQMAETTIHKAAATAVAGQPLPHPEKFSPAGNDPTSVGFGPAKVPLPGVR